MVLGSNDDEESIKKQLMEQHTAILSSSIDKSSHGVCVQTSTLGSLEAMLSFLKDSKIPVFSIGIGPVQKKDILQASKMLEQAKEYAVLLAFDVRVGREEQELADELGVRVFKGDIIYHLFDQFTSYMKNIVEEKRKDTASQAIFPCILKIG